jgi:hypothetical protein
MSVIRTITMALVAVCLAAGGADAAKKKAKPKKKAALPAVATKETTVAIEKLMGVYKWGMTTQKVLWYLEKDIRDEMEPTIKKTADPLAQDRLRKEMFEKIKDMKAKVAKFDGKQTPWDVSLVDKEFAHKNNESMAVVWGKKDRRFYFFHHDKLWKIYIAFNTEMYEGKTFDDFAGAMETRFGKAEKKYETTLKGEKKFTHMAWPPSATTLLRAIDNTGFYGNFCLALTDKNELANVRAGRKVNSPKKSYSDPLVDAVTKGSEKEGDDNEDVVDKITGKGTKAPSESDSDAASAGSGSSSGGGSKVKKPGGAPPPEKPKKKVGKNPLDGLDI